MVTLKDVMKQHGIQFEQRAFHNDILLAYDGRTSTFALPCCYRRQAYEAFVWVLEEAACFASWEMVRGDVVGTYMRHNQIRDRERGEREYASMKECAEKLRDFFGSEVYQDLIASEG